MQYHLVFEHLCSIIGEKSDAFYKNLTVLRWKFVLFSISASCWIAYVDM